MSAYVSVFESVSVCVNLWACVWICKWTQVCGSWCVCVCVCVCSLFYVCSFRFDTSRIYGPLFIMLNSWRALVLSTQSLIQSASRSLSYYHSSTSCCYYHSLYMSSQCYTFRQTRPTIKKAISQWPNGIIIIITPSSRSRSSTLVMIKLHETLFDSCLPMCNIVYTHKLYKVYKMLQDDTLYKVTKPAPLLPSIHI